MGIGYTALAAALDRMDHGSGNGRVTNVNGIGPHHQTPPAAPFGGVDNQSGFQQQ
jgi:hypothetical protein